MRSLVTILILVVVSCNSNKADNTTNSSNETSTVDTINTGKNGRSKNEKMKTQPDDLEELAFEGISIDFQFNSNKPSFGDLFLIVGHENPNYPANSKEFEKLKGLGFEQTDDYFGIKNDKDTGDDVKLWLYPLIKGKEVYHNNGPFDAIRITYVIVRNDSNTADLFEKIFTEITSNLDVTPTFKGKGVDNYNEIKSRINETIRYCREELKVEPGSDNALQLDW
jgi:hypothetical protein